MKKLMDSLVAAFSMYSIIPMPRRRWEEGAMRYAMCFFPLIGAVVGGCLLLWGEVARALSLGALLFGAGATVLPLALSGGIHFDGFLDTCDALGSRQNRERKLAILKDSATGAFALLGSGCYLLLSLGLWGEVMGNRDAYAIMGLGFVLSRSLSGLSVTLFPKARQEGILSTFAGASAGGVSTCLIILSVLTGAGMLLIRWEMGLAAILAALLIFVYYRVMSVRQFGGTTGDVAGYFLTLCEVAQLFAIALITKLP